MRLEKEFKIPIPGTKLKIYAKQYGSLSKPIVVFVHGLTGHRDEHQFYNGARYFYKKGFSSVRFNLYDYPQDARRLVDCTLKTHAHDVDAVVDLLKRKGAQKMFAVGHSYGAPSIILSSQKHLQAMVLWDGTHKFVFDEAIPVKGTDFHRLEYGPSFLIGKKMYDEAKMLKWDVVIKRIRVPVKFIYAERSGLARAGKQLYKLVQQEKSFSVISGAGHVFSEAGAEENLFADSARWFKKFL